MKRRILFVLGICLLSVTALGLPDYPMWTTYYDSQGNIVGERDLDCAGHWYTSGTTGESFTTEFGDACNNEVQLYTCEDFNLAALPGESFPSCVSEGYRSWWCAMNPSQCT